MYSRRSPATLRPPGTDIKARCSSSPERSLAPDRACFTTASVSVPSSALRRLTGKFLSDSLSTMPSFPCLESLSLPAPCFSFLTAARRFISSRSSNETVRFSPGLIFSCPPSGFSSRCRACCTVESSAFSLKESHAEARLPSSLSAAALVSFPRVSTCSASYLAEVVLRRAGVVSAKVRATSSISSASILLARVTPSASARARSSVRLPKPFS